MCEILDFLHEGTDNLRLQTIEHLSVLIGRLLSFVIVIALTGMALFFGSCALVIGLAACMGWEGSLLVTAFILLCAAVWVHALRRKLFKGVMIGTLCRMFFERKK